jgi:hypothetical protein
MAINRSGEYPDEVAIRASNAGAYFLVLMRHKETGAVRQIEWSEA